MFNFIKKNFALLFMILFIIVFSIFNREEFIQNYENKTEEIYIQNSLETSISNFKLENLKDIKNLEFYYTPYTNLLDKITNKIKSAKSRVYVEVYMLTEKRIKRALVEAEERWIEVKIVLEKNPYKATWINNKHFKYLDDSGIDIVWSNSDLYALNHSKFMIIDNEVIVSSGNFTYSTFAFNRDLFLFINDKNILEKFLKIFIWDFGQKYSLVYWDNLILSPDYSRKKFEIMFEKATKNIDMYFQYLQDSKLEKFLIEKAKSWVKVRVVVSENFIQNDKEKIKFFKKNNIEIKALLNTKMHSKAILIDWKYLFIWSVNFSSYSLDKNREIGLIFTNKNIISDFSRLFEKDFANN